MTKRKERREKREGLPIPPKPEDELGRAIWLLMSTDDYQVTGQGDNWAELIYVHNSPPHPVTRIEVRMP